MKKLIYSLTALLAIGLASSCKKYIDINTNPNVPTKVDASTLLPSIQAGMARGVWFDSRYVGQYSQTWGAATANNVWDQEGYAPGSDAAGEMWRTVYFSIGQNANLMLDDALATKKYDYAGVTWAIRAWGWQNGGDLYDYMIVKQAYEVGRLSFDYDAPSYVYAEVVKDCQTALNYLNLAIKTDGLTVSTTLGKGDYMYYGDRNKWKKFIYAILAQNALHQSNKATFNADLVAKYADSSFVNNADNASVEAAGTQSGDANFWGPTRANLPGFRQSDYIVKLLDGRIFRNLATQDTLADPRLPLLLSRSKDRTYRGVLPPFGDPNSADANTLIPPMAGITTDNKAGGVAKYIFNDNSRGVLMTYPEVKFFKAEALFKKGDKSGALTAYQEGVRGSLDFVSNPPLGKPLTGTTNYISATAINNYMTGPSVRQTAATLQLSDIMQQKFISLFVWGTFEAWADERRYLYSTDIFQGFNKPANYYPDNSGKPVYVIRPRYNSEYIWNLPALKAIGALNPDYHTKQPWVYFTIVLNRMMKKTTYIALGLLLAVMAGCKKNSITQIGDVVTSAQIKLIHTAPGVPALNGYINNNKITPTLSVSVTDNNIPISIATGYVYLGVFPNSNYASVTAGSTAIKIEAAAPAPVLKSPQTVAPGTSVGTLIQNTVDGGAYSVFTMGLPGAATNGLTTKVVEDKFPAAQSGKAFVRFANMVPNGTPVDITGTYTPTGGTATAKTLITNTAYSNVTDFVPVDLNILGTTTYVFQMKLTSNAANFGATLSTALTPGRYYTIIGRGLAADYPVPGTSIVLKATARPTVPASTLPEIYFNPAGLAFYTNK